jgi:hypothetical protein
MVGERKQEYELDAKLQYCRDAGTVFKRAETLPP